MKGEKSFLQKKLDDGDVDGKKISTILFFSADDSGNNGWQE